MTPLRQRMLEDLQIRHYSPTTIRIYLHAVAEFARHFGKPPDQLDAEHIRRYQLFLAREKKVSPPTYVQVVCALRFLYTHTLHRKIAIERIPFPRRERKLSMILSREEVRRRVVFDLLPQRVSFTPVVHSTAIVTGFDTNLSMFKNSEADEPGVMPAGLGAVPASGRG